MEDIYLSKCITILFASLFLSTFIFLSPSSILSSVLTSLFFPSFLRNNFLKTERFSHFSHLLPLYTVKLLFETTDIKKNNFSLLWEGVNTFPFFFSYLFRLRTRLVLSHIWTHTDYGTFSVPHYSQCCN